MCDGCVFEGGSVIGFNIGFDASGSRGYSVSNVQVDANTCWHVLQASEGLTQTISGSQCRPLATTEVGNPPGTTIPNRFTLNLTSISDNGSGALRVTFPSSLCLIPGNCPANGNMIWIVNPNGTPSADGLWTACNVTGTTVDLWNGACGSGSASSSAFISGATFSATLTAGWTAITLPSGTSMQQIHSTQSIAGTCIPAGATIQGVWKAYNIVYVDSAHAPTCSGTNSVTITDALVGGHLEIDQATVAGGGSGYAVGDQLTVSGGTATQPAVLVVATVSGTAVATVTIKDGGVYTTLPSNPAATTNTSGTGSGATFTVSSVAQLVLYASTRSGPCINIGRSNAVMITNTHCLSHAVGLQANTDTSRVTADNLKLDDETLDDETRIGVYLTGNATAVSLLNCGIFYSQHGIVDETAGTYITGANSVSHCDVAGSSTGGYDRHILEENSSSPGTAKNKGFVFSGNFTANNGDIYGSDDMAALTISDNVLPRGSIFCQAPGTAKLIQGAGNVFSTSDGCPVFATAPNTFTAHVAPTTTTDYASCGELISAASAGGTLTIKLPPSPPPGCLVAVVPFTNAIVVDPNGNVIKGYSSTLSLPASPGFPEVDLKWDSSAWFLAAGQSYASSTAGFATQTYTNSPCTSHTTERWIPVTIAGQTGTWYVPACQ